MFVPAAELILIAHISKYEWIFDILDNVGQFSLSIPFCYPHSSLF